MEQSACSGSPEAATRPCTPRHPRLAHVEGHPADGDGLHNCDALLVDPLLQKTEVLSDLELALVALRVLGHHAAHPVRLLVTLG